MKFNRIAVLSVLAVSLAALICGCGGGGGGTTATTSGNTKTGSGKVAAIVNFDLPAAAKEAASTASYTVTVAISISGVYSGDDKEFPDVTTSTQIDMTTGSAKVSVLSVPVGVNHLLTATVDFGGYSSETLKAIIPAVASNEVASVTADHSSTLVAEAAIYSASQKGKRLADLGKDDITAIEDTVAYMYANGISIYTATPEQVFTYMASMGVPKSVSLDPPSATVMAGGTYQFTASVMDGNSIAVSGAAVTWSFSASSVGSVSSSGLFTAASSGSGVLTATYGSLSATASVTVISTCAADTDCSDGNGLTLDVCVNPGSTSSSCTHTTIACVTNSDCGGGSPVCVNGGTASAACIVCASANDCNDNNALTIDACSSAGTSASACTHTPITCAADTDCNDNNALTLDSCSNPGTVSSVCANTPITCNSGMDCTSPYAPICINGGTVSSVCIACSTSSDCGGGAPYCVGGGSVSSICSACTADADCNDNDSTTVDTCNNPSTAAALCSHSTTQASDHISADTTWTIAGSPYIIPGQIVIDPGVTLTIEPGVAVQFVYPASGTALFDGLATGAGIKVSGTLHADGTASSPITMSPYSSSPVGVSGTWTGIYIKDTTTASTLSYINFDSPSTAIQIYDTLGGMVAPQISHISVTNAGSPYTGLARRAGKKRIAGKNSFHVSTEDASGAWAERAVEHYGLKFDERPLSVGVVPASGGDFTVRVAQSGMRSAHMDSALLSVGGVTYAPASAIIQSTGADILLKVAEKDYDVVDVHNKTVLLTYNLPPAAAPRNASLILTAREEGDEIVTSGRPFTYPPYAYADDVRSINYYRHTLSGGRGFVVDGEMTRADDLPSPSFTEFTQPNSGHPDAYVSGYSSNDSKYFYAALDFTTDNTYDFDADYATLYVRVGNTLKKFRVSVGETRYGKVGFTYTPAVRYQHKFYEFKIPLSEIGNPKMGDTVQYMFDAYGTSSTFNSAIGIYGYYGTPMQINMSYINVAYNTADTGYMYGLFIQNATASQFMNISVSYAPYGVYFSGGNAMGFSDIMVTSSKNTGMGVYSMSGSTFNNVIVSDSVGDNLNVYSGTNIVFTGCTFGYTNPGGSFNGATVQYSSGVGFNDCQFNNNSKGVYAYGTNLLKVMGSTISGSGLYGVHIDSLSNPSTCVAIYDSNITNTATLGVSGDGIASVYMDGVYLAGNAGAGAGVTDMSTNIPDSNSTPLQYSGVTSVTGPLSTAFSGTSRIPSECY